MSKITKGCGSGSCTVAMPSGRHDQAEDGEDAVRPGRYCALSS
jgi:hypothetical protein